MPVYVCRVSDDRGKIRQFLQEAASEESCLREVSVGNPFVLSVTELSAAKASHRTPTRFSRKLISELTELIALMLGSGLSLKDSLEVAQGVFSGGESNQLVTLLRERLNKGTPFSKALEDAGRGFPPFYTGMVRIGEKIGSLDQVFGRLSTYMKEEKGLRDKVASALIYPCIVLGVAALSAVFIVVVMFPRLRELFGQLGPGMADRVQSLMVSLQTTLLVIGIIVVLLGVSVAGMVAARRKGGPLALRIDRFLITLPVVSRFLMQRELLNFTFSMEALTAAGVSVEDALLEGAGTVTNRALRDSVLAIRGRVVKGERLSAAFSRSPLFPDRVSRWMAIGERIGHVEKVFGQLRAYYQQEVEKWIGRMMALVEPALIVGLGVLIILFVLFFIVPIFSLYGNIL
jgi:type II secretory pathway component PulF